MSSFSVKVNDQPVRTAMAQLLAKSQDQRVAMADIGEALKIYIDTRFATQSGPNGQKWLSDSLFQAGLFRVRATKSPRCTRRLKKVWRVETATPYNCERAPRLADSPYHRHCLIMPTTLTTSKWCVQSARFQQHLSQTTRTPPRQCCARLRPGWQTVAGRGCGLG